MNTQKDEHRKADIKVNTHEFTCRDELRGPDGKMNTLKDEQMGTEEKMNTE